MDWAWVYSCDGLVEPVIIHANATGNQIRENEPRLRRVRERGVQMFAKYPHDSRRWAWFTTAALGPVYYYLNVEDAAKAWDTAGIPDPETAGLIDTAARNTWARQYPALRAAYLAAHDVPVEDRYYFQYDEIRNLVAPIVTATRQGRSLDSLLTLYQRRMLELAAKPHPSAYRPTQFVPRDLAMFLVNEPLLQQRARPQLLAFLRTLATSTNTDLALYAAGKARLLAQGDTPVNMMFTTVDGQSVDLSKLRGKVVLVDFWDTGCSSCIEAFPMIKAMYERYHDQGFEVVSVNLDPEANRSRAVDILAKHALPWPQVLIGGTGRGGNPYVQQYQIYGVPEMFLLDQHGRLVENGYISRQALHDHVTRLLGA